MEFFIDYPFNPINLFLYATVLVVGLTILYIKKGKPRSLEKLALSPGIQIPAILLSLLGIGYSIRKSFLAGDEYDVVYQIISSIIWVVIIVYVYNYIKKKNEKTKL